MLNKIINQTPKPLLTFLIRGLLILIIWKIGYLIFLKPDHRLDAQLSKFIGSLTTWIFAHIYPVLQPKMEYADNNIFISVLINGVRIDSIAIADACNGLELMMLYLGFIFAAPYPIKKKLSYIFAGVIIILLTNVLRCLLLMIVFISFPSFFVFAHHYLFTILVYLIIFLIWMRFIKNWIDYEFTKN